MRQGRAESVVLDGRSADATLSAVGENPAGESSSAPLSPGPSSQPETASLQRTVPAAAPHVGRYPGLGRVPTPGMARLGRALWTLTGLGAGATIAGGVLLRQFGDTFCLQEGESSVCAAGYKPYHPIVLGTIAAGATTGLLFGLSLAYQLTHRRPAAATVVKTEKEGH